MHPAACASVRVAGRAATGVVRRTLLYRAGGSSGIVASRAPCSSTKRKGSRALLQDAARVPATLTTSRSPRSAWQTAVWASIAPLE